MAEQSVTAKELWRKLQDKMYIANSRKHHAPQDGNFPPLGDTRIHRNKAHNLAVAELESINGLMNEARIRMWRLHVQIMMSGCTPGGYSWKQQGLVDTILRTLKPATNGLYYSIETMKEAQSVLADTLLLMEALYGNEDVATLE
ncbi:hypothetical protein LJC46_03335 [Desulfovibrio sp. OttesenSCG-928-G15]|nr:hypothetical protein [Desulfovibrio sp. OttesenSCG-928-G15]